MSNPEVPESSPRGLLLGPRLKGVLRGLERAGVVVEVAADGEAAVRAAQQQSFDLVVCDLEAARMTGPDLLRRLRRCDLRVPVVLLYGRRGPGPSPREAEQGARCLEKPVRPEAIVRTALQQIRSSRASARPLSAARLLEGAAETVSASVAKNEFGRVLEAAMLRGHVVITKHDAPTAVLLSIDEYAERLGEAAPDLRALRRDFGQLLERMQTPEARRATHALFEASPAELGSAAVNETRGARRSRRSA